MVHFQVRPTRSVTYWLLLALTFPVAALFARVIMFPCFSYLFLACSRARASVSASRLSLRAFSSLRFNSIKISKRPPGFSFPGGCLFFLRCVAFSPLLWPSVSLSRRRGCCSCVRTPPCTRFVRCRGRPDCSRGAGRRRLLRGLRRPRFRRGIVRRRRCYLARFRRRARTCLLPGCLRRCPRAIRRLQCGRCHLRC